jgi:hypothetical protein
MPDGNDDILKTIDDALGYQPPTTGRKYQSLDVPSIVDDELGNLGYSDNARLAILGNLGRENSWNPNTIFGGHVDPKNGARNRGIISWQGDRQQNLDNYIKSNGGNWWPTEDNLRLQARFLDQELRSKYPYVYKQLTDPNAALPKVSRSLRNYINYSTDPQYNTPDKDFDVANNRIWAQKAQKRGLGSFNTQGVLSTIDDALSTHDSALGAGQQPDQEALSTIDDALNTFDNASGVQPSSTAPTRTPPVGPTEPEQQMPALKPVTEPPQTIQAQVMSMMDKSSPRSAVLITQDDQTPLLKNVSGLTPVQMPEGTLFVNSKKLGIKPKDVPDYVQKNGFAGLIGKVEDVGNNTGQGLALRTEDANGNELSTSIVSPENIAKQAVVDKAQFPQAAKQDVMPAQVAAAKRQISTGNSTDVQPQTKPQAAYGNPVEGAEEDAVLTPEEQASLAKNPAKVPPQPMPKPQPKTAQVIGTADVDPKASDEDQLRQAMQKLLIGKPTPTGPINQDDIENVINIAKQRGLKLIVGSENPGQVTLPEKLYDDILKLKAKSPEQMAEELKQRTIAPPTDDALRQQAIDQLNEERRAGKATNQTDVRFGAEPSQPGQITEDEVQQKMADLRALEPSQEEKSIKYDYAQTESPFESGLASGFAMPGRVLSGVLRPFSKSGYEWAAKQSALLEKESPYRNQGEGPQTPYEHIAEFLGATGPQLATIIALPGEGPWGTVAKFAFLGGSETAGRGGSTEEIGKSSLTGAGQGAAFGAAGMFENPLAKLGTVFGGSALVNAASGMPIDQNLQSAIVNTLYEAQGTFGSKLAGKFFQFWKGGEPLTVGVTPEGEVIVPRGNVKTENQVILDPENPVYKNETQSEVPSQPATTVATPANVPNTEIPQPEKISEPVTGQGAQEQATATETQPAQAEQAPAAKPNVAVAPDITPELHEAYKKAFELPLLNDTELAQKARSERPVKVTFETPSGKQITKVMSAGERQKQLENKGKVLSKLLDCIHG